MSGINYGFLAPTAKSDVLALESLGVDSLWCGGHVASTNPTPEAMVQLARLSALTERVTIGTAILTLPLYSPAIIAKQVADLDGLSGGRLVLGVGVGGEYPQEFRACQVDPAQRGGRTDEAIAAMRELWTGEETTFTGRHFTLDRVRIHPSPVQPGGPPVVVAGRAPRAMRRAAELGDGWLPYLYSARRYADSVATIGKLAAGAGRDLAGFRWMAFLFVNIRDDPAHARSEAAAYLGMNYRQDFAALLEHVAVVGGRAEVTAGVQRFVDAGARHLVFAPTRRGDTLELARELVDDVMPRISLPRDDP